MDIKIIIQMNREDVIAALEATRGYTSQGVVQMELPAQAVQLPDNVAPTPSKRGRKPKAAKVEDPKPAVVEDDEDDEDDGSIQASKIKAKNKAKAPVDEDEDDEAPTPTDDDEQLEDEDGDFEDDGEDEPAEFVKDDPEAKRKLLKALTVYSKAHTKQKAVDVLKKFAKGKPSTDNVAMTDLPALMKALKV